MTKEASSDSRLSFRHSLQGTGLTQPSELTLSITSCCNLSCSHQSQEIGFQNHKGHVPFQKLKHVLHEWHEAGLPNICLCGGEPFLHPEWQEIIDFCCSLQGFRTVRIQSNGTTLDQQTVSILAKPQYQKVAFQISLDGCTAEVNDRLRGEGSFAKTLAGLRLLHEAGLAERSAIDFLETTESFDQLDDTLRLADELKISQVICGTLVSAGRTAETKKSLPSPEQYLKLIDKYENDTEFKRLYDRLGTISAIEWYLHRDYPTSPDTCSCMSMPFINSQGYLYPCTMLSLTKFAISDVWQRPLKSIIAEIQERWSRLHQLSLHRPDRIDACRNCSDREHCQSGCLGRSGAESGDFFQVEDRCLHRKAVYSWKKK